MAGDDSGDRLLRRVIWMSLLDGIRPSGKHALYDVAFPVVGMVLRVRYGLRHPRRLTVGAIADETWNAVFYVLRVSRAVQRRRPRIAAGSALVAAGAVARLRAASAEPLR
jgi:hypothetical protein